MSLLIKFSSIKQNYCQISKAIIDFLLIEDVIKLKANIIDVRRIKSRLILKIENCPDLVQIEICEEIAIK